MGLTWPTAEYCTLTTELEKYYFQDRALLSLQMAEETKWQFYWYIRELSASRKVEGPGRISSKKAEEWFDWIAHNRKRLDAPKGPAVSALGCKSEGYSALSLHAPTAWGMSCLAMYVQCFLPFLSSSPNLPLTHISMKLKPRKWWSHYLFMDRPYFITCTLKCIVLVIICLIVGIYNF